MIHFFSVHKKGVYENIFKFHSQGVGTALSAPACYGSSLDSNTDIYQKYKIGDISNGVANVLFPAKKYTKKLKFHSYLSFASCMEGENGGYLQVSLQLV
jgi:hypothetical protein